MYINNNLGTVEVKNNSFYNNGRTGTYRGDLWIQNATNNINESNNSFYRSGTAWDSSGVIEKNAVTYDINHIIGSSAGYWQYASGQGADDIVGDIKFVNPSSFDFRLQNSSPAINAGTDVGLTTDFAGNPKSGANWDIGAYEFQDSTAPVTTTNINTGTYNSAQNVTLTCDDGTGVGCDKTYYTLDNSTPATSSSVYSTALNISTTTTLKYFSQDKNGNSESINTKIYTIDTTPPAITIANPNTNPAQTKTLTASTSDGTLTMSNTTGNICDNSLTFIAYADQTFTNESDNNIKVCYKAEDSVGNIAYSLSNAILGIDTTPPTITIDPYTTQTTNQDITVTASTNEGTLNTTTHTFTQNGSFDFIATDQVGNQTTQTVTITNIDKTPVETPTETQEEIKIPAPKLFSSDTRKSFSSTLKSSKVKLKHTTPEIANGKVQIKKGNKLIKEVLVDQDGNWSTTFNSKTFKLHYLNQNGTEVATSKEYKLKIDNEKPRIKILAPLYIKHRGSIIDWQASDNKGIDYYVITFGTKKYKVKSSQIKIPSSVKKGPQTFTITAYDEVGNKTSKKGNLVVSW